MANSFPLGIDRAGAIARIDRYLMGNFGARRLQQSRPRFTDGWQIDAEIAGRRLQLDVEIPEEFPIKLPRIFVVDPPAFPTWPHVEADGRLCIVSAHERYDRTRPEEVMQTLIEGAFDILEQGITGTNVDDFRTEFLAYWNHAAPSVGNRSLMDPSGPSRPVRIWRGKTHRLIADSKGEVRKWLANRGKLTVADVMIEDAVLLWFDRPPLPAEYPKTAQDLFGLAASAEGGGVALLERMLRNAAGHSFSVFIGANAGNGICFGEAELELRRVDRGPQRARARLSGAASLDVRLAQWKLTRVTRRRVERVDPFWVHGRDLNADLTTLRASRVAVIGCGSLGSQVARLLALAGVAELHLLDAETLEWANVGRHALGADWQGQNKAVALAKQLGREFPHSQFVGHASRWQDAPRALDDCDLVVSTTGSLDEESGLAEWQQRHPGSVFVFGWTEPRASASQAGAIMPGAGCLLCGFDALGDPVFQATTWTSLPLQREPACGAWFMPYGADEIMSAALLVTDMALDVLTERARPGAHRVSSGRTAILEAADGAWSDAWKAAAGEGDPGGRQLEAVWPPNIRCPVCGGKGAA